MKYIFNILLFCFFQYINAQGIPDSWMGKYQGIMKLYSSEDTPYTSVPVTLYLKNIEKDLTWQYQMIYGEKAKPGYVEKDYRLELRHDTLYMNEGEGVLLPMRKFGECLMDFYSIKDINGESFMTSVLCLDLNGDFIFHLYGGSLIPIKKQEIIEKHEHELMELLTYRISFDQSVRLIKVEE